MENETELKPKVGVGVPDGDGGSIEKDDADKDKQEEGENLEHADLQTNDESEEEENPLEDEGDWSEKPNEDDLAAASRSNSLGNDTDNRRENESIEGAINNPGVQVSGGENFTMLKYFGIEFYDSEEGNRSIGCGASLDSDQNEFYYN